MNGLKATKIYARFASEVYDDFGEPDYEQEYYRKEHADEELRATKHALWMTRATILKGCWKYQFNFLKDKPMEKEDIPKWQWAERKCREKAKEYE